MFSTAANLAAEHSVSEKTVKRAGKFAEEVAKTADTSTGTSDALRALSGGQGSHGE